MHKEKDLAILILAAGTSSRLGEPKQLLKYKDETLLQNACKKALSLCDDVYVVLGANHKQCEDQIKNLNLKIIENKNYKKGLSTSIKAGVLELKSYDKVLIMLCDQPFISTSHLKNLIERSKDTNKIICSFYKNDVAVPAIFSKHYFDTLVSLEGDKGAKKIIKENEYEKLILEDSMAIDIDTKEDKKYLVVSLNE